MLGHEVTYSYESRLDGWAATRLDGKVRGG